MALLDKDKKITFFTKEAFHCPVCDASFHREELYTGGGRQNVGPLTDELHRTYIASEAFGEVYPLLYPVTVCPSCYYAAFQQDFLGINPKIVAALSADIEPRIKSVQTIFPALDFNAPRGLREGAAAYALALRCYDSFSKEYAPTVKQGVVAIRLAWLFGYLHKKFPNDNWDYLQQLLYRKALFFYKLCIEKEQKGKEAISNAKNIGPDTDKNYGYEGVLYLKGLLELKYGQRDDMDKRGADLEDAKRTIAKMFGLGRSSKSKPGPLLELARDLYDKFKAELDEGDDADS